MRYQRMPIEVESPEEMGYRSIEYNLSESSFSDAKFGAWCGDLDDLTLAYGAHRGTIELRELIADSSKGLTAPDVLVVPGAAAGLFIVHSSVLEPGSSMLVVRPNYATNIATPRLLQCSIDYLDLKFENGFEIDVDEIASRMTPETRLVSVTYPHNPTGVVLDDSKLRRLIGLVERHHCYLLVDETYRDLNRASPVPVAAALSRNAISVSSLSKSFGLPGIRMGWILSRNPELQEIFLAAKEQIFICNSVIDEEVARRALSQREAVLSEVRARVDENFRIVCNWMTREEKLEWVRPQGGVVCLPRMRDPAANTALFYDTLLRRFGTYVGAGHWFEMSDRYFRLGYGWESKEKLAIGLANISSALRVACA